MKETIYNLGYAPICKIKRAKHHIEELTRNIDGYLSEHPFELIVRNDPSTEQRNYFIITKRVIPENFSLMIGDAVHNLRTALDVLIFSMICHSSKRPETIQFPFSKGADSLKNVILSRQIKAAGDRVVKAIIDIRPYPGGDDLLFGLHSLDIIDKHRLILTVGCVAQFSVPVLKRLEPSVPIDGNGNIRFAKPSGPIITINITFANRAERRAFRFSEKKTEIQPAFQICFGEGQPFAFQPILAKLEELCSRVEGVIDILINEYVKDNCGHKGGVD